MQSYNFNSDCDKHAETLSENDKAEQEFVDKCLALETPSEIYQALRKEYRPDNAVYIIVNDPDIMKKVIADINIAFPLMAKHKGNNYVEPTFINSFIRSYGND